MGRERVRTEAGIAGVALAAAGLLLLGPSGLNGQGTSIPDVPDADPADVSSVDAIITALYDVISGPVGEERDFDRFRSLFSPHGRLLPTTSGSPTGYVIWTPEQYWEQNAAALAQIGFTESELSREVDRFGLLTQVFSTYEAYRQDEGEAATPFARGINSIQLVEHGGRFWILTVAWDSERPDNPIPNRYLGGGGSPPA